MYIGIYRFATPDFEHRATQPFIRAVGLCRYVYNDGTLLRRHIAMDELTRAVFDAVYRSAAQRGLRMLFGSLLLLKHTLRGFAFSWPLYLLALAGLALPGDYAWLFYLLLIPALMVSGTILLLGLSEEYSESVHGRILKLREWRRIVLGSEA